MFSKTFKESAAAKALSLLAVVVLVGTTFPQNALATDDCNETFVYNRDAEDNIDDSRVSIDVHFSPGDGKLISVSAKTGYEVTKVEVDFTGGSTNYVTIATSGPLDHFDPSEGNVMDKYKITVKKVCVDACNQETTYTVDEDSDSFLSFSETNNRVQVDFNNEDDGTYEEALVTAGTGYSLVTVEYDAEGGSESGFISVSHNGNSVNVNPSGSTEIDKIRVKVKKTCGDTVPPTIQQPANISIEGNATGGANVSFSVTATDDVAPALFAATCVPASGSLFLLGVTTVTCNANDTAGNAATPKTFTVTVVDTTKPIITLNGSAAINLVVGATYTESGATASDIVDSNVPVVIGGATVNTAVPGIYTITYNGSDDSGNAAIQKTRSVTVTDVVAPVIVTPGDITEEAVGPDGNVITYIVTATDDVGVVSVSCTPVSGNLFAIGSTPVDCTAYDAANNPGYASFTVTVQDTIAPVVTISPPSQYIQTTNLGGVLAYFDASATDAADSNVTIFCDTVSGGIFPIGSTLVTCTGTDDAGNSSTAVTDIAIIYVQSTGGSTDASPAEVIETTGGSTDEIPEVEEAETTDEGTAPDTAIVTPVDESNIAGEVLGLACEVLPLTSYLGFGNDNADDVKFVQGFLNNEMGSTLDVNGIFNAATKDVVKSFQLKYANEVLAPWVPFGLSADSATGLVYKTTQRMINMLSCPGTEIPMPELP